MTKRAARVVTLVSDSVPEPADYFPCSDLGNAERFVDRYAEVFRYDHQRRAWLAWQGHWWATVEESVVFRAAVKVIREIRKRAGADSPLYEWLQRTESGYHLKDMIGRARNMRPISVEVSPWDQNDYLFAVANGVIDLTTGKFRAGERTDYITQHSPVLFDLAAISPAFDKFFDEIFLSRPELCRYVLKALGYSMTGDARERCLFVMHGSGNNGKSLLSSVIGYVMGDYGKSTPSETLSASREEGPRNDIARLAEARYVSSSESALKRGVAEEMLKRITGKDVIVARFLHREFFEFIPRFKFWLSCNHKPPIQGVDAAIWSRIPLIPFDGVFRDDQDDKDLDTKLLAEAPGILNRLIEGCLLWQREGLQLPECIRAASADYRSESNPTAPFIDAVCEVDQSQPAEEPTDPWATGKGTLFTTYVAYCQRMKVKPDSKNVFSANIKAAGFDEGRKTRVRWWKGIRIAYDPANW
jgi:putative DNA primase/helicase